MVQSRADLFTRKLRPRVSTFHDCAAFALQNAIVDLITDAERRATVTRRRLNEDTLERRMQQYLSVHDGVVSDTAGKTQVSQSGPLVKIIQDVKRHFFETLLQARSDVAFTIRERCAL